MDRPQKFGRYLLIDRISTGGMAAVFLAKVSGALGFQKVLAIKRILPSISEDQDFITMFIDEAKISASLAHSNIGQVFEFGQVSGQYYIAMEYIPGKDLRTIQKHLADNGRTMEVPLALHLVSRLCQGLDYAHRQKDHEGNSMCIVHRDVSPPNIIVSYDGGVKLIDFGIAKAASRATRTRTGRLKGKFAYMSPEQVQGQKVDQRADVFSVGILLHELLTNQRLFLGPNQVATMNMVRKAEVDPPSALNSEVPPEIDGIVLKALAREKEERYSWCTELRADIERFFARSGIVFEAQQLSHWMKNEFSLDLLNEIKLQERIDTLQLVDAEGDAVTDEEKLSRLDPHLPRIFAKNPNWDAEGALQEPLAAGALFSAEEPNDDHTPLVPLPEVMSGDISRQRLSQEVVPDDEFLAEVESDESSRPAEAAEADTTLVNVPSFVEDPVAQASEGELQKGCTEGELLGESTDRNKIGAMDQEEESTEPGVDKGSAPNAPLLTPAAGALGSASDPLSESKGETIPLRKQPLPFDDPELLLPPSSEAHFASDEAETFELSDQAKTNPRVSSTSSQEIESPEEPLFKESLLQMMTSGVPIFSGEARKGEVVGGALEIDSAPDLKSPVVDPLTPVDLRGMGDFEIEQYQQPLPAKASQPARKTAPQTAIPRQQGRFSSTQRKAIAAGVTLLIGSLVLLVSYLIKDQASDDSKANPNTGTLIVTTRPPAMCSVSIGATPKGVIKPGTPFSLSGIATGRYQITLECLGFQPYTTFVDVGHAQVSFVEGQLKTK